MTLFHCSTCGDMGETGEPNRLLAAALLRRQGWKIERHADASLHLLCPSCAAREKRPQGYPAGGEDGA